MKKRFLKNIIIIISVILLMVIGMASCTTVPVNNTPNKEKARVHVDMGTAYLKSGQYSSALREFISAEKLNPRDPEIHYYLGISYYGIRFDDKAVTQFKKAIDLKSNYPEAHNYLGSIYLKEGLYDKAIKEFQMAISDEMYETPAIALNNMGWTYYKKGDYKTAIAKYNEALTTAIAKYNEALTRDPHTNIPFLIQKNIGIAYLADNQTSKAIHHLKESLQIAPYIAETHYWLGMSYLKRKEYKKAVQELRVAVEINPESRFGQKAKKHLDSLY